MSAIIFGVDIFNIKSNDCNEMTPEYKYGVPVAARVDVLTARKLRKEATERNVSLARRLADLIEQASVNEANIQRLERAKKKATENTKEADQRFAQLKTKLVTWLLQTLANQEDVEQAIQQINRA